MISYYMKIDGIAGGSADKDHVDWIDLKSYSWVPRLPKTTAADKSKSQPPIQSLQFIAPVDKSSMGLYTAVATGRSFKTAKLDATASLADAGRVVIMQLAIQDAAISGYQTTRDKGSLDEHLLMVCMVEFLSYKLMYFQYDKGKKKATLETSYNWK